MKRRYRIERKTTVRQFDQLASEDTPHIRTILPTADSAGPPQQGKGRLLREAGLAPMNLVSNFSTPRRYILDGSKVLKAAVRRYAGEAAFIRRCQVHPVYKKRNVVDHLPAYAVAYCPFKIAVPIPMTTSLAGSV